MVSSVLIYPDVITLLGSNIAQAGATFGVAAKTKDKELREMAIPAGISALLAGVTEPAMYGVRLRLKKTDDYNFSLRSAVWSDKEM